MSSMLGASILGAVCDDVMASARRAAGTAEPGHVMSDLTASDPMRVVVLDDTPDVRDLVRMARERPGPGWRSP